MNVVLLCLDRAVPLAGGRRGASVHLRSFASALLQAGHSVATVCADAGEDEAVRALTARGLDVRPLRLPATVREIDWHFSRVHPDLVIERLTLGGPQGAMAAREAGIPHVYVVDTALDEDAARRHGAADGEQARLLLTQALAHSTGAVATSEEIAAWVRSLAPAGFPVAVEANGAGPGFFEAPRTNGLQQVMQQLRFAAGEFRVGFVGSLQPWHDLGTLVAAVAGLGRASRTRLVLVGDGPARNALLRQAWESDVCLTLSGSLPHDDMPALLSLMDVIAVPSGRPDSADSPIKLFEAMAAARAIVATETAPVARVVEHGRQALLVPPSDPAAMTQALRTLRDDPALRAKLGAEAKRAAESRHTWDAVAERVLAFAMRASRSARESCGS